MPKIWITCNENSFEHWIKPLFADLAWSTKQFILLPEFWMKRMAQNHEGRGYCVPARFRILCQKPPSGTNFSIFRHYWQLWLLCRARLPLNGVTLASVDKLIFRMASNELHLYSGAPWLGDNGARSIDRYFPRLNSALYLCTGIMVGVFTRREKRRNSKKGWNCWSKDPQNPLFLARRQLNPSNTSFGFFS